MFFSLRALLGATLISAVSSSLYPRQNGTTPSACAVVASQVVDSAPSSSPTVAEICRYLCWLEKFQAAGHNWLIHVLPAQLAYDCIQSVPLNTPNALELVKTIRPYLNWHSTTAYLKNPPAEYVKKIQAPVDLFGGLDKIEAGLKSGFFKTEYDFGFALYTLFQSAHDGHLTYLPDSVGRIFQWGRPVPLVSVSEDGEKLPAIFVYADILAASQNETFQPSRVTKINGEDAITFMQNWSQVGVLHDRDALWNNAFYNLASISLGSGGTGTGTFSGGGRGRWVYPGATTELTFANGSTASYTNYARLRKSFKDIATGEDLAKMYFNYANVTKTFDLRKPPPPTPTPPTPSPTPIPAPGYPNPIFRDIKNAIGGYYLDDAAYSDVAVLSVASFEGLGPYQQVSKNFLTKAVADGKKRLVIDVSANSGGYIIQGYDLFIKLFPHIDPFAAGDRFRAHESFDLIGQFASNISGYYPRSANLSDSLLELIISPNNYRSDLDANTNAHFTSWPEKYGPETHHGDTFTKLQKWWWADPLTVTDSKDGFGLTGFTIPAGPQPFDASNVVIVYDGYCASTCSIFSEMMRRLVGIQTVVMGGRPNDDIIQAVGGTKGTNNYVGDGIQSKVVYVYNYSTPAQQATFDGTSLGTYNSNFPWARAVGSLGINARDGIRKNDTTNTPLQFRYEEADCRLYYTPEMTVDVTYIWKAVVDVRWGKEGCVAGSWEGGSRKNKTRRAVRSTSETAKIRPLGRSKFNSLMKSLETETETRMNTRADGIMLP
ncbi:peptidase S41 family protein [Venturia nashicola]|nr:peptidase S41 family protein [Venturia nashicola]